MIEEFSLLNGLSAEAIPAVAAHAVARSYPRNAVVISEGDEATSMFIIKSGSVKVYHTEPDGRETILNTLHAGQHFGELALIDSAPRSVSVMTLEPSTLLTLSKTAFRECLAQSPEIAYNLIAQLTGEVRRLTATVNMMSREVYGRIKGLLESMAVERDGVQMVELVMTQQDIASRIASSREMVSRVLKELKKGGYIDEQGKRLVILKRLPANW